MISLRLLTLILVGLLSPAPGPAQTASELPFDLTERDIAQLDPSAISWSKERTFVGGVEGELHYDRNNPHLAESAECRAAALVGLLRLRNLYVRERDETPVSIHLGFRCRSVYGGTLTYDGVVMRLELRDHTSGRLIYQGRARGLPGS